MALTKLPKNAIGTGAIDASKIEDGTIQNAELAGSLTGTQLASTLDISSKTITLPNTSVTSDQLVNSTIANNKLSNSTFTIRGTSRALGDSFSLNVNVDWQSVIVADGSTATTGVAGRGYFIITTSAAHTFTLPASATRGDTIALKDYAGTFASNKLTIARNGHNIQGVANNSLIGTNRASLVLVYVDSTKGWLYAEEHNVANLGAPVFISATGGTVATSGNFKIHSFTGDGCFVVSTVGNISTVPTGGPGNVDYLVVAGGGGSGGSAFSAVASGGGGAGGYRTTFPSPGCNAGSFPITTTTYPITVGGGGSAGAAGFTNGTAGSDSIFSTITSTGGGRGGQYGGTAGDGGSGGGSGNNGGTGGTGNSPPVSPSQGNSGGNGRPYGGQVNNNASGGGGGGIGGAGSPFSSSNGGPGGPGSTNSISGSPVTYAGGGGGGGASSGGSGGPGGGGAGSSGSGTGTAGTANTGGGAGGSQWENIPGSTAGSAGGKGIVIIRYKFQ